MASCTRTVAEADSVGDPLPGLTDAELARFTAGRTLFDRVFSVNEGTGPLFNENQCSACHTFPAVGGTGEQLVIKATRRLPDGSCDILASEGGENLRRRATPALAQLGIERDTLPSATAQIATFSVPFLFGLGAADLVRAPLYSDLLVHDLGPALASTCAPGATETEYRTAPLLGLGARRTYLHDLRASTLDHAVLLHGGEAQAARDGFEALPIGERQALLRFLRSL